MNASPLELGLLALLMIAVGGGAGVLAGLLGVGGGIIVVPALYLTLGLFDVPEAARMHIAVATSLATIIPTSITSARAHHRRGGVDVALLRSWGPWIAVGVVGGALLASRVGGAALTGVFGVVALIAAAHMAFVKEGVRLADAPPTGLARVPLSLTVGGVSVMMGIGGGTMMTPILTLCGAPIKRAVGTAAAVGLIIGVPGTIVLIAGSVGEPGELPWSLGHVSLIGFVLLAPLQTLMAPYGAALAHRISTKALKRAFALFLALTAARMLHRTFVG